MIWVSSNWKFIENGSCIRIVQGKNIKNYMGKLSLKNQLPLFNLYTLFLLSKYLKKANLKINFGNFCHFMLCNHNTLKKEEGRGLIINSFIFSVSCH